VIIETAGLRLQPVSHDDLPDLVALDADPAVMRFVSGGPATAADQIADWVIPRMQAALREHGAGMWVLRPRSGDGFLGWVQLRRPRHSRARELELSYRLRREQWGRGLAVQASAALIAVMFTDSDTDRIFASTHPANAASRRVMEKLGMRLASGVGADDRHFPAQHRPGGPALPEAAAPDVEYELLREHWLLTRGRGSSGAPESLPA